MLSKAKAMYKVFCPMYFYFLKQTPSTTRHSQSVVLNTTNNRSVIEQTFPRPFPSLPRR